MSDGSASSAPARNRHFRNRPRPQRVLPVQYAVLDAAGRPGAPRATETRNIGVGGAFLVTDEPPPVGTRLSLRLTGSDLPEIEAEVRWVADPPRERGVGVRFAPLAPADLLALVAFLGPTEATRDEAGTPGAEGR